MFWQLAVCNILKGFLCLYCDRKADVRTEKGEKDWGEDTQQGAAVEAVATAEGSLPAQLPGHPTVCVFVCDFSTLLSL